MKLYGILWDPMEFYGNHSTLYYHMLSHGVLWHPMESTMESCGVLWNPIVTNIILYHLKESYGVVWNPLWGSYGIVSNSVASYIILYFGILWKPVHSYGMSWYPMELLLRYMETYGIQ